MATLKQFKPALLGHWHNRAPRERTLLLLGAAVILAGVVYAGLWQPLERERSRLRTELPALREQVAKLQSGRGEVLRLRAQPSAPAMKPEAAGLRQVLEAALAAAGLTGRIADEAPDRATLALDGVDFGQWLDWQARLQADHRIRIESCTIEAAPAGVKIQAVLVR